MSRIVVHHLGRAGEVPGGMTQVLNGYLGYSFDDVEVEVITTRGDPHDLRAGVRNAARAFVAVARLRRGETVVVAHLSERGSFLREGALLRLAHLRGLGTVAHLHGASFAEFAARFPALVRFALRSADGVISLSAESSEVAARFVPADRVALVPNAIPPGTPASKQRTVVFGGVVSRRKGVDTLLAAWEALGETTEGWRLLVAGPVRDREVVRELPRAEMLGSLPHDALMALLDASQIAVLPSREEAMPMFILEAMARRACVVATEVGGIGPVLAGGRGILLPPGDEVALTAALRAVLNDEALRATTSEAAYRAYERDYSAGAVFPRVEGIWLRALTDAGERRKGRARVSASASR